MDLLLPTPLQRNLQLMVGDQFQVLSVKNALHMTFGLDKIKSFSDEIRFEKGEFTVEYQENKAMLSWPKPSGIFTRQTIQKQKVQNRRKRVSNGCQTECIEEEVLLNQTSHITDIEPGKKYEFKLVLYDGDVVVQSLKGPKIITFNPGSGK